MLAHALLDDDDRLVALTSCQFGRHVVRNLSTSPSAAGAAAKAALQRIEPRLKNSRYSKRALQGRRAPAPAA